MLLWRPALWIKVLASLDFVIPGEFHMRTSLSIAGSLALVGLGYVLGASQMFSPGTLWAQPAASAKAAPAAPAATVNVSDEAKARIKAAASALKAASDALVDENRLAAATKGVNTFAVLTGGVHALHDLENGAVVDPETFAALYANLATDNVAVDLGRDGQGRLTYKGKLIRIYPVSRLRALYAARAELTGEDLASPAGETSR